MSDAITNGAGEIALKYYQPTRVLAQSVPSGKDGYVFTVRANISLAFVDPQDVGNLLGRRAGCNCGGSKRQAFDYANESDVRRWTNGGGR